MAAILGWDFRHTSSMRASIFQGGQAASKRAEVTSVSPGQSWSQVCERVENSFQIWSVSDAPECVSLRPHLLI